MLADSRGLPYTLAAMLIAILMVVAVALNVTQPASESSLMQNRRVIQCQIELYKLHHADRCPEIRDHALPQLTNATNARGEIGPPGPSFPFGPHFFGRLPPNPVDGSRRVSSVARPGEPPTGTVGALGGWQYDEATGRIWPNNPGYY